MGLERVRIASEESFRVSDMVCREQRVNKTSCLDLTRGVRNRDVVARHRLH